MGLKDKVKNAWQRVSDLDDESADAKDQAKAGDRIPYKEISKSLKELMKKNVDVVGRKILIPNYYAILFSQHDREMRAEVEDVLCSELRDELYPEMRKINPEQTKSTIVIEVQTDPGLEKGQFNIRFSMKKPAATPEPKASPPPPAPPEHLPNTESDLKETIVEAPETFDADDMPTMVQPPPAAPVQVKLKVESAGKTQEFVLDKATVVMGRASTDDVTLESADFSISRKHAVIELRDGQYFLTPNGVNGTLLNGEELELEKEVAVSPDDEIAIMDYKIKIIA